MTLSFLLVKHAFVSLGVPHTVYSVYDTLWVATIRRSLGFLAALRWKQLWILNFLAAARANDYSLFCIVVGSFFLRGVVAYSCIATLFLWNCLISTCLYSCIATLHPHELFKLFLRSLCLALELALLFKLILENEWLIIIFVARGAARLLL